MTLESADWRVYHPHVRDDTAANGGPQSWDQSVSGAPENVWPDLDEDEVTVGYTGYRKVFHRAQSPTNAPGFRCRAYYLAPTAAGDRVYFHPGTDTDTQGDLTGSERLYGSSQLAADVSSGSSIDVTVEDGPTPIFFDGDGIYLIDATKERYYEVSGPPTVNGNTVTLSLATAIGEAWVAANTMVSSVYAAGDVAPTVDNEVVTSTAGTFDVSAVVPQSKGSYAGTLTLTFTSTSAFDAALDAVSIGSGNTASDFSPVNAATGAPYTTIPSSAWGGTFVIGDTVAMDLHPPSIRLWEKRIVPAGTSPLVSNQRTLRVAYQTS